MRQSFRQSWRVLLVFFIVACGDARDVGADISYGVTGSSGNGTANTNSIYSINTSTGVETLIGATAITGNSFAFNATNGIYYYGDHGGSNLYGYSISSGTSRLLGNLDSFGKPSGTTLSGGADFYNGRYYYSPEVTNSNLYFADFTPGGTGLASGGSIAITLPGGISSLGDFGDIAIDPLTGIMFGSSSNLTGAPDTAARLWTVDLNDPTYTMTVLATTPSVYQIAFDDAGNLVANEWMSGNLYRLNQTTGVIETTLATAFGGDFFDLATAGQVPEPASGLVVLLCASTLIMRRRGNRIRT